MLIPLQNMIITEYYQNVLKKKKDYNVLCNGENTEKYAFFSSKKQFEKVKNNVKVYTNIVH